MIIQARIYSLRTGVFIVEAESRTLSVIVAAHVVRCPNRNLTQWSHRSMAPYHSHLRRVF